MRTAVEQLRRNIAKAPFSKSSDALGWSSIKAWRARHDGFTASLAPMRDHLLVGYFNQPVSAQRTIDGKRQCGYVREGTLSLIPAGAANMTHISAPVDIVHVYIPAASMRETAQSSGAHSDFSLIPRLGFEDKVGAQLLSLLAAQFETVAPADELFAQHLSELINLHLLRHHSNAPTVCSRTIKGGLAPWQLKRVREYLDAHLGECVTLPQLAALAQRSRSHFISAFRQSTGSTPHAYLRELRVARAQMLLRAQPDRPVADIALACGFANQAHLTDAFRKLAGTTPVNYRRHCSNADARTIV